jgi:hypothetical protein
LVTASRSRFSPLTKECRAGSSSAATAAIQLGSWSPRSSRIMEAKLATWRDGLSSTPECGHGPSRAATISGVKRLMTLIAIVAVLGQTGCIAAKDEEKPQVTYHLGVYFYEDATAEQRSAVEARLKTLPKVTDVHLLSGQDAYKVLESANPEAAKRIDPSGVPDSLRAVVTDPTLIEPVTDLIGGMPNVSVTGDTSGGFADPKAERGVIVKVDEEGQADIENAIKAIPNASTAVFESGGDAYTRMKHRVDGLSQTDALASYRFKVTFTGGISREQQALATVRGVRRVIVVPASAL